MKDDWNEDANLLAAGAVCPQPGCGEINFAYHDERGEAQRGTDRFDFQCSRCGGEFSIPEKDLLFHSVRREWLWAGNHSA